MSKFISPVVILLTFATLGFSQSAQPCDATKDVRIDRNHPGVYLSFERLGKAVNPLDTRLMEPGNTTKSKAKGNDVWLRLHNNTCWPIQLLTLSSYLPKEKKPAEKFIDYVRRGFHLENDAEISIDYDIEEKDGRQLVSPIDSFSVLELPAGVSVLFSVAREHLSIAKERRIYVRFNYAWEVDERGFARTNEPQHRVEYRSYEFDLDLKK